MKTPPKMIVEETDALPAKVLAESIAAIARGVKALNQTRLKRRAVVALIHDQSKLSKRDIELVLNNLEELENDWLKPE